MSSTAEFSDTPNESAPDNDYASRMGQSEIPVVRDDAQVEDPIDAETADSDETLGMSSYFTP